MTEYLWYLKLIFFFKKALLILSPYFRIFLAVALIFTATNGIRSVFSHHFSDVKLLEKP